ncbi:MAG TPA: hypothetical protein VH023_11290 [Rhodopila sp.]|jgi:hypothetical protein|nr:hypothetical protein [Rhodopila sp.]
MPTTTKSADPNHDKTVEDSFPASDPPANSGITGVGRPDRPSHERPIEERPTGTPNSDRHAAETAHQWEDEERPPERR